MGDDEQNTAMPTHELMAWLDDAARDRFVKLQETFETDGWRLIVEYVVAKVTHHGIAGANATTWEKVNEHRGARYAYDEMAKFAESFMTAFEQMAQSAKDDAAAKSAEGHE